MNSLPLALALALLQLSFINGCFGARKLFALYQPPPMALTYHNGALLEGDLHVSILWYGKFSAAQKSIVFDFFLSLNPHEEPDPKRDPSVSQWWKTVNSYVKKTGKKDIRVRLADQIADESCSIGKTLKRSQISDLGRQADPGPGGLAMVLTRPGNF